METAKEFQKLCKGLQHVGIPHSGPAKDPGLL